jgi:hypothetical protein
MLLLFFLSITPCLSGCGQHPSPTEILGKAVEAHGGEEQILKPRAAKIEGKLSGRGNQRSWEEFIDLPHRWRRSTHGTLPGKHDTTDLIVNDGQVYARQQDGSVEERATTPQDQTTNSFGILIALVNIQRAVGAKDKEGSLKLSWLGEKTVRGSAAFGIRVKAESGPPGEWYFDKKTYRLVKAGSEVTGPGGKTTMVYTFWWDCREVDGVMLPYHGSVRAGQDETLVMESEVTSVQILKKFDAKVFSVP